MTGHVILYLGRDESASEFVDALEQYAVCDAADPLRFDAYSGLGRSWSPIISI